MEQIFTTLAQLQTYHVGEICFFAAIGLFLIDYFFPVDAPAHIAYFLFGVSLVFLLPLGYVTSALIGMATWIGLAILHRVYFHRFLSNAPGATLTGDDNPDRPADAT
ncbi:MAG: hypothetical protein KDA60_18180 [Planctomycetales bacterium]|nr:hypothetical protein [Planctomycetales bacterium]